MKIYIYNIKTHTLHIEGFCHYSNSPPDDIHYKSFRTEDEAIAFDGRAVSMCKLCQAKRDHLLIKKSKKK